MLPKRGHRSENVCAIKYFENIKTIEGQQKFLNMIKIQSSLKHEAITPLIGYCIPTKECNKYGIITKFMSNGKLSTLIEQCRGGMSPDNWETIKAINIFGIASGMAYIHQHDVIFRDLKPDKIVLDENFHPKISDFHFSKRFKQGTENQINQTLTIGTPIYMAPEVFDDEHYSNKIDVYSYSMILYELLTLERPWDNKKLTIISLYEYTKNKIRPTISDKDIPEKWIELIERCWDQNPNERPSFIQIVGDFLDNMDDYFDFVLIDEDEFRDYIDLVIEGLNFDELEENNE